MVTVVNETNQVSVPSWVDDLASFRRWMDADEIPEKTHVCYLKGDVWVDMSREQIFSHTLVETEIAVVLGSLVKAERLGRYFADGVLLSAPSADISGVPDGLFLSHVALEEGRARLVKGAEEGYVELEGAPDMVLEVVSRGSEHKDKVFLREAYWEAGIREYWLVDARRQPLSFEILRYAAKGYVASRKQQGWIRSAVFGKAFQLRQTTDVLGHPEYNLALR
jgi:Uma2 family endonuclease